MPSKKLNMFINVRICQEYSALSFRRNGIGSNTIDSKAMQISDGFQYFSARVLPSTSGQNGSL